MVVAYCPSPAFSLLSVPLADSLKGMRRWFLPVLGMLLVVLTIGFLYWLITSANHAADQMFVRPAKAKSLAIEHIESKGLGHYKSVEFKGLGRSDLQAYFHYDGPPGEYFVRVQSKGIDGEFAVTTSGPHYQGQTETTYAEE